MRLRWLVGADEAELGDGRFLSGVRSEEDVGV